ncbi:MAG: hypothetical protein AB7T06_33660 [Kofleriaceae bacterium]|jgi:hypothetical protein
MATPPYIGAAQQPSLNGDWFSRLGSFFGGTVTPMYAPAPPAPAAPVSVPSTAVADSAAVVVPMQMCACMYAALQQAACPIDLDAIAAGQIAIVIPRKA